MQMLRTVSIISVLCTVPIWLFVVPQLVFAGVVEVGGGIEAMVVLPTLLGLPISFAGAIAGAVCIVQRRLRGWAMTLMGVGQMATIALAAAIIVWALGFASTGWELIVLPSALMLGQAIVAAGLIGMFSVRYRSSSIRRPTED
ncbi:hypothetical protein [Rhodococcus sp. SJ-2]